MSATTHDGRATRGPGNAKAILAPSLRQLARSRPDPIERTVMAFAVVAVILGTIAVLMVWSVNG
jgi:hypothetical protein